MTHTHGPFRPGKRGDSIVSDHPIEGEPSGAEPANVDYYGGHLIAESVAPCNRPLLIAAPDLLDSLAEFVAMYDGTRDMLGATVRHKLARAEAALAKAGMETSKEGA